MSDRRVEHREAVECALCGEAVPRDHSVMSSDVGRVCWFCYSNIEDEDADAGWDEDGDWDEDDWDD